MDMTTGPKTTRTPIYSSTPGVDEAFGKMLGWIGASFEQEDGPPVRTIPSGLPYYTVRLGARKEGDRVWELELIRAFQSVLEDLKAAGATKIIWRTRPYLDDDGENQVHYIRARLITLNDKGEEVKTRFAVPEGALTPRIDQPTPEMPTLGYDFLGPREEAVVLCAMITHNVVKALNDSKGEPTLSWDESRASAMQGVLGILDNPLMTSEQSHQSWMDFKIAEGWKLGPVKDPALRTHPLLIPYDQLPEDQKVKDSIFGAIVRTFFGI